MEVNKRIAAFSNITPYNLVNRHQCALRSSVLLCRSGGNSVPTFWYKVSVPFSRGKEEEVPVLDFLTVEVGTDWMSRNVGTELPLGAGNIPKDGRSPVYRGESLKSRSQRGFSRTVSLRIQYPEQHKCPRY